MAALLASAFLFLALAAGGLGLLRLRARRSPEVRLRELRRVTKEPEDAAASLRKSHSSIPRLQRMLAGSEWADKTSLQLRRANLHLRVGEFVLLRLLVAAALGFVLLLLVGGSWLGWLLAIIGVCLGYAAPGVYLNWAINRRLTAIEKQLVELVPSLASSLRAGFAFQQALETAAEQVGPPIRDELVLLLADTNLGASMEEALLDMSRRIGSTDLDMIVTAILVQRSTGGNLSEVLDRTGETMGEREQLRGDILTFTAAQRMTGLVLSVYPVLVGLLLLVIMPDMWGKLFTESEGQVLLAVALGLQFLGFLFIRRVLRVDF